MRVGQLGQQTSAGLPQLRASARGTEPGRVKVRMAVLFLERPAAPKPGVQAVLCA